MNKEVKRYEIVLRTLEPFRIGAIEDPVSSIHNPLATVGKRVVIQGPSLKGAFRAELEQYLIQDYPDNPEMKPCIPSAFKGLSEGEKRLIEKGKYRRNGSCVFSRRERSESICPVCYLLGAQGLVGFVRIPYLITEEPPESLYSTRIDRVSNTVAEGTNHDYQIMRDGIEFKSITPLEILLYDPAKDWTLGREREGFGDKWIRSDSWTQERILKELIVDRLEHIEILGGFKSKGCGKVKITLSSVSKD